MKRMAALVLSLMLLFCAVESASGAKMVQTFSTDFYRIYIPGDWIIDTSTAADYWGAMDFGYMYPADKSMFIEAKMFFYSDWSQDSLWLGAQDLWEEYIAFLTDDLKNENPQYLGRVYAGQFPAAVFSGVNAYGAYLYGEIMINAYAYGFYFYQMDENGSISSEIAQENVELFESILQTFVPAM